MSGGYKFDADGIQEVINQLRTLLEGRLAAARQKSDVLRQITPPGDENMSKFFAEEANRSGNSYIQYLDATIEGIENYVDELEKAHKRILEQEENTMQALKGQES